MRVPWTSSEPRKIWAQAGQAMLTIAMTGPRPGRGNLRLAAVPGLYYAGGTAGKGLARRNDPARSTRGRLHPPAPAGRYRHLQGARQPRAPGPGDPPPRALRG